ncbi:protein phosphatase methylesterase 1 isoform X1 [Schistocerca gregaria]|uniref:protein phosphatase methylesterase 1 isoform X1 n=1 Tax=Schistocerca gregaria TaxID=7010 RepID=UPI00211DD799|nr:protein phosphatase methylesterase 1 isoform X1 [Schistocerca gregaria]
MSSLQKKVLKTNLPPGPSVARRRLAVGSKRDYAPTKWNKYFSEYEDVHVRENTFRVYKRGDSGPALVLLHGGGFSALTWAVFSASVTNLVACRVLAIDLRGHGDTETTDDEDLSAKTMASDVGDTISMLYGTDAPPVILIGHSMGGAIAVHVAAADLIPSLCGLVVIDVVEGTAMDALTSMQSFLRSRPTGFKSIEQAVEYSVRSGQVRNLESAKVSMPGQIKNCVTNKAATNDLNLYEPSEESLIAEILSSENVIQEEPSGEENDNTSCSGTNAAHHTKDSSDTEDTWEQQSCSVQEKKRSRTADKYTWRIDLAKTEKYWSGWFKGLSNIFLNCPVPKMLLLAGIDRLDKELMVGQMQGKFQLQVLGQCGHAVHEDVPEKLADIMASFMDFPRMLKNKKEWKKTRNWEMQCVLKWRNWLTVLLSEDAFDAEVLPAPLGKAFYLCKYTAATLPLNSSM